MEGQCCVPKRSKRRRSRPAPEPRHTHLRYQHVPTTRGQCRAVPRPCPFLSCRYHIWADIKPRTGHLPEETCALDVADEGAHTLEQIGDIYGLTRERVRQILAAATAKLLRRARFLKQ